jgi:hypothetical protein
MLRYFIDTEFVENQSAHTLELVSLALVGEDGREYYAQAEWFNPHNASQWIWDHVFASLQKCTYPGSKTEQALIEDQKYHVQHVCSKQECVWQSKARMKKDITAFLDPEVYGPVELHGWCAGYDFVVFCQAFGGMLELPAGYPHYIHEIQQVLDERGLADSDLPPQSSQAHHALDDALYLRDLWHWLQK